MGKGAGQKKSALISSRSRRERLFVSGWEKEGLRNLQSWGKGFLRSPSVSSVSSLCSQWRPGEGAGEWMWNLLDSGTFIGSRLSCSPIQKFDIQKFVKIYVVFLSPTWMLSCLLSMNTNACWLKGRKSKMRETIWQIVVGGKIPGNPKVAF